MSHVTFFSKNHNSQSHHFTAPKIKETHVGFFFYGREQIRFAYDVSEIKLPRLLQTLIDGEQFSIQVTCTTTYARKNFNLLGAMISKNASMILEGA